METDGLMFNVNHSQQELQELLLKKFMKILPEIFLWCFLIANYSEWQMVPYV